MHHAYNIPTGLQTETNTAHSVRQVWKQHTCNHFLRSTVDKQALHMAVSNSSEGWCKASDMLFHRLIKRKEVAANYSTLLSRQSFLQKLLEGTSVYGSCKYGDSAGMDCTWICLNFILLVSNGFVTDKRAFLKKQCSLIATMCNYYICAWRLIDCLIF